MKRVRKSNPEPAALREWKKGKAWKAAPPPWDEFPTQMVRQQLKNDQQGLCCYCCAAISDDAFHIEHFRSRDIFPRSTYEWLNMLASCESRAVAAAEPTIKSQDHCGKSKGNVAITVDPQSLAIADKFRHSLDGKIHPSKSLSPAAYCLVEDDIVTLNLRAPALNARRSAMLSKATGDIEVMTKAEWKAHYLDPDGTGWLQEFWPALKYNFDKHKDEWWP